MAETQMGPSVNWKAVLFAVLDGIASHEGVVLERYWKLTPELRDYVEECYNAHEAEVQQHGTPIIGFS